MPYPFRSAWFCLLSALGLTIVLAVPVRAGSLPPDLNSYIEKGMKQWKIPGLAIAVVKDGKIVLARGYGVREFGKPDKVDENTLFAIGSTSKAFTATAIGSLVDKGLLQWDTHLVDVWPGFKLADPAVTKEIRVSDLLANHSGFSGTTEALWYGTTYDRENILQRFGEIPLESGFRYTFQYRNVAFLAAGQLVPRVQGLTWDQYVTQVIFNPLGMTRTAPTQAGIDAKTNVARPHLIGYTGDPVAVPYRDMTNIAPAGGIVSSARDMAQWVMFNLNGGSWNGQPILQPETLDFIQSGKTPLFASPLAPPAVPPIELVSYCLGWGTHSYEGRRIVWHNGGIDGMSTWVGLDHDLNLGVVVVSNLESADLRRAIFYKIIDSYEGNPTTDLDPELLAQHQAVIVARDADNELYQRLVKSRVVPTLPLAKYAGTYRNQALGDITMAVVNGGLVFTRSPLQTLNLVCKTGNTFLGKYTTVGDDLRSGKTPVEFQVEKGVVTSVTYDGIFTYYAVGKPLTLVTPPAPNPEAVVDPDDGTPEN